MKNNYKVYCHILKNDGRQYFGITCQSILNRWRSNGNGYKTSLHFYRAIKKYGWDAFEHELIIDGLSKKNAEKMEKYLISKYKTYDDTKGFNIAKGGRSNSGFHQTEETRKRISEKLKGKTTWNKGKHLSEEHRSNISLANKGKCYLSHEQIMLNAKTKWKAVKCIETNIVYKNVHEAINKNNGNKHIIDVCKGKRKTACGYHWQYV